MRDRDRAIDPEQEMTADPPYGTSDFIHSAEFYDRVNRHDSDLPFYRERCQAAGGPVLELCCGTGRLTVPLAAAGIAIAGLDRSPAMLTGARGKGAEAGVEIEWLQGDLVDFDLGRRFALLLIPFNSLQCIYSLDDIRCVFANIRRHLAPGGRLIFDIFNPDVRYFVDRRHGFHEVSRYRDAGGQEVVVSENCRYDAAGQVNRVTWRIQRGDEHRDEQLDMRCFYPVEMDALLELGGFVCLEKLGSFDGEPFAAESAKMIYVCEAA